METTYDRKILRNQAVNATIQQIKTHMMDGVSIPALEASKQAMLQLAAECALFSWEDFPPPEDGDRPDQTYLLHQDEDGGYAMYVNSSKPGQEYGPHDHAGAWAIMAGVHGPELHRLYTYENGVLRNKGEVMVNSGTAVAVGPEGIHSIHSQSEPLLHLNLYAFGFEYQGERRMFDPDTGELYAFDIENFGFIEDMR